MVGFISVFIVLITSVSLYLQRYHLLKYLPSTIDTNYSYQNGSMVHIETGKLFSGRLRSEYETRIDIVSYKNGLMNGITVSYRDGKVIETGYYKDDMQEGLFRLYMDNGILFRESNFSKNQLEGVSRHYYESGKLHQETNYINGLLDGTVKQYNEKGILIMQMKYENGIPKGQACQYYDDGRLKIDAFFNVSGEDDVGINATYWDDLGNEIKGKFYADGTFYPEILEDEMLTARSPEEDEADTKKIIEFCKSFVLDEKGLETYTTKFINDVVYTTDNYSITIYSYSNSKEFLGRVVYKSFGANESSYKRHGHYVKDAHFEVDQYDKHGKLFKEIVLDKELNLMSVAKYDKDGLRTSFIEY